MADAPKQYRRIGGVPIIARTLLAFLLHPQVDSVAVAIHADDADLFRQAVGDMANDVRVVIGGSTRQDSVRLALETMASYAPDIVLIHDAVRPFVPSDLIDRVINGVDGSHGCIPAVGLVDTIKRTVDGDARQVAETVDRSALHAAQTPQGFPYSAILESHRKAKAGADHRFTDDASIAEWAGLAVRVVDGDPENIKLTFARDIEMADLRLTQSHFPDVRTGNGYDVHAFEAGDAVTLCGVRIPHDKRLSGHSDADVGLHALTDALLATCGAGDIGTHFPPSDPQWRGAASRIFVEYAAKLVRERAGRIANADITLICEAPRIGPHREAMTAAIATMLAIEPRRISVKATTNERLGFVGREEGIAAIATATVVYPGTLPP